MKRTLFIIILFGALWVNPAFAQVIQGTNFFKKEFGIKVGLNYQMVKGLPWVPQLNSGIIFGVYKDHFRAKKGWRIECNFTQAHYVTLHPASYQPNESSKSNFPDTIQKGDFNALYIRIPLLAEYHVYKTVFFLIGPEYSQQISITDNNSAFTKDYSTQGGVKSIFKSGELMGTIGLESKIKKRINCGLRFSLGLTNINKGSSGTYNDFRDLTTWKLWSLQATFGFRLKANYL